MADSYQATFEKGRPLINPTSQYSWMGKGYLALFLVACGFLPVFALGLFAAYDLGMAFIMKYEAIQRFGLIIEIVAGFVVVLTFLSVFAMYAVWLERKVSGRIQGRVGPMEVGFHGFLQTLADGVKLMAKEDLIPATADKVLFILAPIIAFTGVLLTYLIVPFHGENRGIIADLDAGLYFLAAVASVEAIGIIMAGWASNNKWSLFGTMRTATQVVSYELPIGICFLSIVVVAGSLKVSEIVGGQEGWFWSWNLLENPCMPFLFIIYMVAQLAETKRAPFDLPEAESELVAGFHTEYSSMRFSLFFLSEYASMYVVAVLAAAMFLGGWFTGIGPLDDKLFGGDPSVWAVIFGSLVMVSKATLIVFVQIWVRWTYPRVRLDQVMTVCLKYLLPLSMVLLFLAAAFEAVF